MSEEPEKMLPQQWRAAGMRLQMVADHQAGRNEKTSARDAIKNQQHARRKKYCKRQQPNARCNEPRPGGNGQTGKGHAFGTQVQRGGDEIQGTQQLADAEKANGNCPQILSPGQPGAGVLADCAQRSISGPTGNWRPVG